jgi:hypothetical protein
MQPGQAEEAHPCRQVRQQAYVAVSTVLLVAASLGAEEWQVAYATSVSVSDALRC